MGYLVAMEVRVIFIYMLYSIGSLKIDEVRKYAKIVFYLTSCDAKTLRHASWGLDISDRYCDKEHLETNQKSLRLPVQKLWLK